MQILDPHHPLYIIGPLLRNFRPPYPWKNFLDAPLTYKLFVFEYTVSNKKLKDKFINL